MTKNDWTDELRDRLSGYEAASPNGLWEDIEQSLPKAKSQPLWLRWTNVAAVVALLMGAGWWLWLQNETPEKHIQQQQHMVRTIRQQQPTLPDETPKPLTALNISPTIKSIPEISQESLPLSQSQESQLPPQEPQPKSEQKPTTLPSHPIISTRAEHEQLPPASTPVKKHKSISVGLHANNGLLAYSHTNGVQMSPQMAQHYDYSRYLPTRSPSAKNEVIWLTGYEERQHHDHPVSLGLTVNYSLTERWSVQTGLVYTRLHSDFVSIMRQVKISKEQTLDYMGIPLSAQYLLWGNRQWKLYASAGIQMDWNISAKLETEGVRQEMEKDHLQWSADGALGIEYNPIPQLGIYAEPGFRYYFDNGSKVQNFFKDQPASWTLQLGIRLNLGKQ